MAIPSGFGAGPQSSFVEPLQAYFGGLDLLAQSMSLRGMARCQLEFFGLISRRTQAFMEIPSRLQQCRTPQDLMNEQARFVQTSFAHYTEATQRMTEAMTQAFGGSGFGQPAASRATARDYITFGSDAPEQPQRANGHDRRAA